MSTRSPIAQQPHIPSEPKVCPQNGADARSHVFRNIPEVEAVCGEGVVAAAPAERDVGGRVTRVAIHPGGYVEDRRPWDLAVQLVHRPRRPVNEGRAGVDDRVTGRNYLKVI